MPGNNKEKILTYFFTGEMARELSLLSQEYIKTTASNIRDVKVRIIVDSDNISDHYKDFAKNEPNVEFVTWKQHIDNVISAVQREYDTTRTEAARRKLEAATKMREINDEIRWESYATTLVNLGLYLSSGLRNSHFLALL